MTSAHGHPLKDFGLGAVATSMAVCITNPLDVIKTRMQLQDSQWGSGGAAGQQQVRLRNPLQALWTVGRYEGMRGLQRGLSAAIPYQVCMNGFRLGAYTKLTKSLGATQANTGTEIGVRVLSGLTTGFIGNFIASPFYLLKIRFQSYSTNPLTAIGTQHSYDGLLSGFAKILHDSRHRHRHRRQTSGRPESHVQRGVQALRALFHGATVGSLRVAVASAVQLTAYDSNKIFLASLPHPFAPLPLDPTGAPSPCFFSHYDPIWLHTSASLLTGVLVMAFMTPIDVVATRLYNQPETKYVSAFGVARALYAAEGFKAFYKGLLSGWLRVGPHTLCTFVFLEKLRECFP